MITEAIPTQPPERWKNFILVLIVLNTLLGAVVAFLQTDANIKASQFNIDSQYYAILGSGELIRQSIQGTYDMASYGDVLKNTQESLVYQYTALEEESKGDQVGSTIALLQSSVLQARADKAKLFSNFFTDPRYAPQSEDQVPNSEAYLKDQTEKITPIITKQNAASDAYHLWSKKSDSYVAILTILAVAFLSLGLAQSLASRIRVFFAVCGLLVMGIGTIWCLLTLIG